MIKKIKNWMTFMGTKNLIAIGALLILVIAISVGIAVSNSKSDKKADKEVEESTGLQVEENADNVKGDTIDASEFLTEDEKKDDSSNKQEGGDKTQSGSDGQGGSDSGNDDLIVDPDNGGNGGNGGMTESPGDSGNSSTTGSDVPFGPLF